jgi:hypothetical protein
VRKERGKVETDKKVMKRGMMEECNILRWD